MPLALRLDARGRLCADLPDGPLEDLAPVRCFPLAEPDRFVALVDARGREVASIDDPSALDQASRALLAAELHRREFLPVVRRIRSITPRSEPSTWDVETDRGDVRFVLPGEDNVRRLGPDGALVVDDKGVRYRLERIGAMDAASRALLRRYL